MVVAKGGARSTCLVHPDPKTSAANFVNDELGQGVVAMHGGGCLSTSAIPVSPRPPSTCLQPMVRHHEAPMAGGFVEVDGARDHMALQFSTAGGIVVSTRLALFYLHVDMVIGLISAETPTSAEAAGTPVIRPDLHVPSLQIS